ncbi:hypothetical protein ACFL2K_01280 [Candidatus Margulisiibacteriota bacterium]
MENLLVAMRGIYVVDECGTKQRSRRGLISRRSTFFATTKAID